MPPDSTDSGYAFLPQSWQAGAANLATGIQNWASGIGSLHIPFGSGTAYGQLTGQSAANSWLGGRGATLVIGLILIAGGVAGLVKNA